MIIRLRVKDAPIDGLAKVSATSKGAALVTGKVASLGNGVEEVEAVYYAVEPVTVPKKLMLAAANVDPKYTKLEGVGPLKVGDTFDFKITGLVAGTQYKYTLLFVSGDIQQTVNGRFETRATTEPVAVNEFMASNGDSLVTANGKDGLDWIELRNDGDVAEDVSGWYLSDNPDKAESKWKKIEGNAVVPAHGTLYYTLDGSDPRASGGAVSAQALAAPADGLVTLPNGKMTIRLRAKTDAEWSAEEQVTLIAPSGNDLAVVANLRLAEVMSNPIDDAEAGSEYAVLVNRSPTAALDLTGVRLTCTKVKKGKLDGDPSVDIVLGAIVLEAGASVTLTKADHWADSKITNGGVEIQLFNAMGATAQTARIDTSWFDGACDGKGSAFQALTFGSETLTESDWTAVTR